MEQITEYEKPWTAAYAAVHGLFVEKSVIELTLKAPLCKGSCHG